MAQAQLTADMKELVDRNGGGPVVPPIPPIPSRPVMPPIPPIPSGPVIPPIPPLPSGPVVPPIPPIPLGPVVPPIPPIASSHVAPPIPPTALNSTAPPIPPTTSAPVAPTIPLTTSDVIDLTGETQPPGPMLPDPAPPNNPNKDHLTGSTQDSLPPTTTDVPPPIPATSEPQKDPPSDSSTDLASDPLAPPTGTTETSRTEASDTPTADDLPKCSVNIGPRCRPKRSREGSPAPPPSKAETKANPPDPANTTTNPDNKRRRNSSSGRSPRRSERLSGSESARTRDQPQEHDLAVFYRQIRHLQSKFREHIDDRLDQLETLLDKEHIYERLDQLETLMNKGLKRDTTLVQSVTRDELRELLRPVTTSLQDLATDRRTLISTVEALTAEVRRIGQAQTPNLVTPPTQKPQTPLPTPNRDPAADNPPRPISEEEKRERTEVFYLFSHRKDTHEDLSFLGDPVRVINLLKDTHLDDLDSGSHQRIIKKASNTKQNADSLWNKFCIKSYPERTIGEALACFRAHYNYFVADAKARLVDLLVHAFITRTDIPWHQVGVILLDNQSIPGLGEVFATARDPNQSGHFRRPDFPSLGFPSLFHIVPYFSTLEQADDCPKTKKFKNFTTPNKSSVPSTTVPTDSALGSPKTSTSSHAKSEKNPESSLRDTAPKDVESSNNPATPSPTIEPKQPSHTGPNSDKKKSSTRAVPPAESSSTDPTRRPRLPSGNAPTGAGRPSSLMALDIQPTSDAVIPARPVDNYPPAYQERDGYGFYGHDGHPQRRFGERPDYPAPQRPEYPPMVPQTPTFYPRSPAHFCEPPTYVPRYDDPRAPPMMHPDARAPIYERFVPGHQGPAPPSFPPVYQPSGRQRDFNAPGSGAPNPGYFTY